MEALIPDLRGITGSAGATHPARRSTAPTHEAAQAGGGGEGRMSPCFG